MGYPEVPHSHITPAGYLRAWETRKGGGIKLHYADPDMHERRRPASVKKVCVREDFYLRTRLDGSPIYDFEWSLGVAENAAIPIIRQIRDRWPLSLEDKSAVAQFLALQHVRGPAFKTWHERFAAKHAEQLRADPEKHVHPDAGMPAEQAIERFIDEKLESATNWIVQMIRLSRSVGTIFGSMHWTLVEFAKPQLATSDQPVIVWPLSRQSSRPCPNDLNQPVIETLEVFFPVGPEALLLMTWSLEPDTQRAIRGQGRHMGTANAFVVANADTQWFHRFDVPKPWLATGQRPPLSTDLLRGYDAMSPSSSRRRHEAQQKANVVADQPLTKHGTVELVTVTEKTPPAPGQAAS